MKNFFLSALQNIALALILVLFFVGTTRAAPVSTTVQGTISSADASNPFGLNGGDTVTATATYDDSVIPNSGNFFLELDSTSNPLLTLTITLGSYTYQEIDDADLGFGGPELLFTDGLLSSIGFFHDNFSFGGITGLESGLGTTANSFFVDNVINPLNPLTNISLLEGTWEFTSAQTTPIPAPGTWLLFISFIGLTRFFRAY